MTREVMKFYKVTTNTGLRLTCIARNKDEAIRICREQYEEAGEDDVVWKAEYYNGEDPYARYHVCI